MDKVKVFLSAVKKYQFWLLCGVILLTSLGCWWWATGDLAGKIQTRKSALDSGFSNIERIVNAPSHPSQEVSKEINKQDKALKDGVRSAWEFLYNKQKEKNAFPTKVLGADFESQFENLKLKPKAELDPRYRERYQNFIKEYLPKLQALIDVRRPKEEKATEDGGHADQPPLPGAGMKRPGADVEWVGVVDWDDADYSRLVRRFEWQEPPSTLAVVLAQEDLWVYEALLRVIANVNGGVASQANAAVKRIETIEIGRDAAKNAGATGVSSTASSGAKDETDAQRIENRYVDDKGKPVPVPDLDRREFKLMPIRMNLVIDQRRLPKLLVECANSNMPIEVRGVRILKTASEPIDWGASTATPSGPRTYQPPANVMAMTHNPEGPHGGQADLQEQESGLYDIPVEIDATICIFNPPPLDHERQGTGAAAPLPRAPPQR